MADLNLLVSLHSGKESYLPGETLRGTVTITSPGGPEEVKQAELLIFWRTSGIGTKDEAIVHREPLVAEGTRLPAFFTKEFQVTLPQQPWSYSGRLVKINWYVGLYVKRGWRNNQETEVSFQLRPESLPPPVGNNTLEDDQIFPGPGTPDADIFYDKHGRPTPRPLDI